MIKGICPYCHWKGTLNSVRPTFVTFRVLTFPLQKSGVVIQWTESLCISFQLNKQHCDVAGAVLRLYPHCGFLTAVDFGAVWAGKQNCVIECNFLQLMTICLSYWKQALRRCKLPSEKATFQNNRNHAFETIIQREYLHSGRSFNCKPSRR